MSEDRDERRAPSVVAATLPVAGGSTLSIDERRRLVAASLRVGNPGNNARNLPLEADPRHACQIELKVADIRPYEHNPRKADNEKFDEIKASIRACGIRNPLTVTRRPGEAHFIVEAGGNTRLLAIQQLWAETGESCFETLTVMFRPWRCESHVLSAHLAENEQRGELTFWDKANGVVALKTQLEAEQGGALSLRQLDEALTRMGFATNPTTLSQFLFVTQWLRTLAESIPLSAQDVKTIQPRLNALKRNAQSRTALSEAALYATVFEPVFRQAVERCRQGLDFSAADLCDKCEDALAQHLGESVDQLRLALQAPTRDIQPAQRQSPQDAGADSLGQSVACGKPPNAPPVPDESAVSTANGECRGDTRALPPRQVPPANAQNTDARFLIIEQVRKVARLAGIDRFLRLDPTAPFGYAMDASPESDDALEPMSHRAWRLLRHIAQATEDAVVVLRDEPRAEPILGMAHTGIDAAGVASDTALLDWLLDGTDELGGAFWEILVLVRAREPGVAARISNRASALGARGKA